MDKGHGKEKDVAPEASVLISPEMDCENIRSITDAESAPLLHSDAMPRVRYRIRDGYCLRDFCDENLVVPVSGDTIRENQVAVLSPVGRFLWENLQTGQTFGELLEKVLQTYAVTEKEAAQDIIDFLSELDAHQYLIQEDAK